MQQRNKIIYSIISGQKNTTIVATPGRVPNACKFISMFQQIKSFYGKNITEQVVRTRATILAIALCFSHINNKVNWQSPTGIFRDRDGNNYSSKIMPDNKNWMTSNLSINIPGSYAYDSSMQKRDQYGRLYTWKSAQEGCKLLGEGWRLPSIDEWRQLAAYYGGVPEDSNENRKKAYKALLDGGSAGFNAVLGGGRDLEGKYARVDAHGFYWTATQNDSSTAPFCNFAKGSQALYIQSDGEKYRAFSVRCIRDSGNLIRQ